MLATVLYFCAIFEFSPWQNYKVEGHSPLFFYTAAHTSEGPLSTIQSITAPTCVVRVKARKIERTWRAILKYNREAVLSCQTNSSPFSWALCVFAPSGRRAGGAHWSKHALRNLIPFPFNNTYQSLLVIKDGVQNIFHDLFGFFLYYLFLRWKIPTFLRPEKFRKRKVIVAMLHFLQHLAHV